LSAHQVEEEITIGGGVKELAAAAAAAALAHARFFAAGVPWPQQSKKFT